MSRSKIRRGTFASKGAGTKLVVLTILLLTSGPGAFQPAEATEAATNHIELLYSADKAVCGPTAAALSRIHRSQPKLVYVSEKRSLFFRLTHFARPSWIDTAEPDLGSDPDEAPSNLHGTIDEFKGDGSGLWWGDGFFHADVTGDGTQRLVFVRHDALGHDGDFVSVLWVLKPGTTFRRVQKRVNGEGDPYTTVDPAIVDLRVDFITDRFSASLGYPAVGNKRLVFADNGPPSLTALKVVTNNLLTTQSLAQEPFFANRRLYVLAGTPFVNAGLVYHVTPDMKAEVDCLFATRDVVEYVTSH
jgi:hypothetical protein